MTSALFRVAGSSWYALFGARNEVSRHGENCNSFCIKRFQKYTRNLNVTGSTLVVVQVARNLKLRLCIDVYQSRPSTDISSQPDLQLSYKGCSWRGSTVLNCMTKIVLPPALTKLFSWVMEVTGVRLVRD